VTPESADVISADPRTISARQAWATAVVLLAAALAGAIIVAIHYRGVAIALRHQLHPVSAPASSGTGQPTLSARTVALPSSGVLTGRVTVFSAQSAHGVTRIELAADITGGRPHTRYVLTGNDCAGNAADRSWAAGVTDAQGSAALSGPAWTVSRDGEYWLWLSPSSQIPAPGLHGSFTPGGTVSAFPAGDAPCAPG